MKFYSNLKDNIHCYQACLRMTLSCFFPDEKYSFKDLEKITGFKKNKLTWDEKGLLWLTRKKGLHITKISDFDYARFAKEGESYLKWYWKPEIYDYQKKHSDFKDTHKSVQELSKHADFLLREPLLKDIYAFLKQGGVIIASVNANVLDEEEGPNNHTVVVTGFNKKDIIFHDPGLPAEESRHVKKSLFKKSLLELIVIQKKN